MAQVVTLIVWCSGRFFLYTSYFTIFGALFGATNFGRMVAIDNSINGIVGLLQFPFTAWALHGLHGNFTAINMIQALPLFFFLFSSAVRHTKRDEQLSAHKRAGCRACDVQAFKAKAFGADMRQSERQSLEKGLTHDTLLSSALLGSGGTYASFQLSIVMHRLIELRGKLFPSAGARPAS